MKRKHDYTTLLIWSAILITTARYIGAFIASDVGEITGWWSEAMNVLMGLTGLGMGVLDTLGGAYLFDGWRHAMPRNGQPWPFRFRILTGFVLAMLLVGVGILVPFTVSRIRHESIAVVLGSLDWLWAIAVNIAPYLLIGGVTIGQAHVVNVSSAEKPAGNLPESYRKVTGENEQLAADWRKLPEEDRKLIAALTSAEIAEKYAVTDRTARNWSAKARRNGHVQPDIIQNR